MNKQILKLLGIVVFYGMVVSPLAAIALHEILSIEYTIKSVFGSVIKWYFIFIPSLFLSAFVAKKIIHNEPTKPLK